MADAIPVHSTPRKVKVQASPSVDPETGKVIEGDYVAATRENLGDPADFTGEVKTKRELRLPNGTVVGYSESY